jgi:hypothetical protein
MGGGKTHNLLAFGLLARHPELRSPVIARSVPSRGKHTRERAGRPPPASRSSFTTSSRCFSAPKTAIAGIEGTYLGPVSR